MSLQENDEGQDQSAHLPKADQDFHFPLIYYEYVFLYCQSLKATIRPKGLFFNAVAKITAKLCNNGEILLSFA